MKRIIALILPFFILMCLAGCNHDMNYIIQNEPSFTGIVWELYDNSVLIKNDNGEYMVSLNAENKDSYKDFAAGDEITVYYDGNIAETYPMQINKVYGFSLNTPSDQSPVLNTVNGNMKTYDELSNGFWMCDKHRYKYRLEISGRMPNAAKDTTFVYLSNIEEIPFQRAYMAAGLSSNMEDYFLPDEAVLFEMR